MATTFSTAYRAARLTAKPRKPRVPLAVRLGRTVARIVPRWAAVRRAVLVTGGFAAISYALYLVALPLGVAAAGISLLLLDWLTGGET